MERLVTKMFGRDRFITGGDLMVAQKQRQDRSWSEGDQAVSAIDLDCHGFGYFPTVLDMSPTHSNMGSRFAFCSSQESFHS
jgi:hypothetical protein